MKRMIRNALTLGTLGWFMGVAICAFFLWVYNPEAYSGGYTAGKMVFHLFIGGVYGMIAMGSSVLYDIDQWSITRSTVTHFLIIYGSFLGMALIQGWFRITLFNFWIPTIAFVVCYAVIWWVSFKHYQRKVKRMNLELRAWKSSHKAEKTEQDKQETNPE